MSSPSNAPPGAHVTARGWGWRHFGRRSMAVSDLDLDIQPGERVLLLGASGAGKSTLVHALAGVLGGEDEGESSGELLVDGRPPDQCRGRVGLVLQDPDSQVVLAKVGDDVAFGCENVGVERDEIWRRVNYALDEVGLDLPADAPTSTLSGGQKQRLALAGVLAMRPSLLLLDEPTANLDPQGVEEVRDAMARVLSITNATFVVIEHRVAVWRDLVDRVIVLSPGGGVLADDSPDTVLSAQGEFLARSGVWIPGHTPAVPYRRESFGQELLVAERLAIGRKPFAAKLPSVVAEDITFTAHEGEALAVTGPNGAGKSTLALTAAGLLAPAGGSLLACPSLAGDIGSTPHRWRSRQLLTRIGTVFQDPEHQFLTARVRDELAVGPKALGLSASAVGERVEELLTRLRLERLAGANPFTLSGGEKRRLSVATSLATRPAVLVLDEPTFGQDAKTWRELVLLVQETLEQGASVIAVTHDAAFVDAIANTRLSLGESGNTSRVAS